MALGGTYTFCTLVSTGKYQPIERHRDTNLCLMLFLSAAPYALTQDQIDVVMASDPLQRDAWLLGHAKERKKNLGKYDFSLLLLLFKLNSLIDFLNRYSLPAIPGDHLNKRFSLKKACTHPLESKGHLDSPTGAILFF